VAKTFTELLSRNVSADDHKAGPSAGMFVCSTYSAGDGKVVAACLAEMPLACGLAAALSLIPPGTAQDSVKAGVMSPSIQENYHEIANIVSVLLHAGMARSVLERFDPTPMPMTKQLARFLSSKSYVDADVKIASYGGGQFLLLAVETAA
jgi:hypothetical protein